MAFIGHSKSSFYMSEMEGDDLILVLGSPITHIKRQEILNLPRSIPDMKENRSCRNILHTYDVKNQMKSHHGG